MVPTRAERHRQWGLILVGLLLVVVGSRSIVASQTGDASDFPLISLETPNGPMQAALADAPERRGLGYRYIRAAAAPSAIYFLYPGPREVSFHMRDVSFPVRAYWIGEDHCIDGWVDMVPGESGYDSPGTVIAVLEIPGFNPSAKNLGTGDCIRVE